MKEVIHVESNDTAPLVFPFGACDGPSNAVRVWTGLRVNFLGARGNQ
jgi:hypothetical protein